METEYELLECNFVEQNFANTHIMKITRQRKD